MLMMLEYCLSVTDKMLTEPLGGTHDFTRLIWTLELSKDPSRPVVVQGDAQVPYDAVIQLMNALKNAGVESVGLVTDPVESE